MDICAYFTERHAYIGRMDAIKGELIEASIIPIEKIIKNSYKENIIKFYEKNIKYERNIPIPKQSNTQFFVHYIPKKEKKEFIKQLKEAVHEAKNGTNIRKN